MPRLVLPGDTIAVRVFPHLFILIPAGKFDQNRSHRPFAALMDALNSLCARAQKKFSSDEQLRMKEQFKGAFGVDGLEVISNLMPQFRDLMKQGDESESGKSQNGSTASSVLSLSGRLTSRETLFELKIFLRHLIKTLAQDDIFVLFIDDLQWATIESLELLEYLMLSLQSTKFMFVGGFRSNEVTKHHCLTRMLDEHNRNMWPILSIGELKPQDVTTFIALSVQREETEVAPLSDFIHERTKGNIFHVRQYLESLHSNGHLYYCLQNFRWEWEDLTTIQDMNVGADDITTVVTQKILKLVRCTILNTFINPGRSQIKNDTCVLSHSQTRQ